MSLTAKLTKAAAAGDRKKASNLIKKIRASDKSPEMAMQIANLCLTEQLTDLGLSCFRDAVRMKPEFSGQAVNWIMQQNLQKDSETCLQLLEIAHAAKTNHAIQLMLALRYTQMERFEESDTLLKALEQASFQLPIVYVSLGDNYFRMNHYQEALTYTRMALKIDKNNLSAQANLGTILTSLNRSEEAVPYLEKAVKQNPNNYDLHSSLSNTLLKLKRFSSGGALFRDLWFMSNKASNPFTRKLPVWKGGPIDGKRLLIFHDQGIGDQVMYSRFLDRFKNLQVEIGLVLEPRMIPIFQRSFPYIGRFISTENLQYENVIRSYDYCCPLSFLFTEFIKTEADITAIDSYLQADHNKVIETANELERRFPNKVTVAFSWRGGHQRSRKYARTTTLEEWKPLFDLPQVQPINVQYDARANEVSDLKAIGVYTPEFDCKNDIESLSALLSAVDLCISVDNSTIHLAGALGTEVWTILPQAASWRWFEGSDSTQWYPKMRLHRQSEHEDLGSVLKKVIQFAQQLRY